MTKAQLETNLRNKFLDLIREMVNDKIDTAPLDVSANEIAVPCLDEENNETFAVIKVSIPRGTRNGQGGYNPYDGYKMAELYNEDKEIAAEKKKNAKTKKKKDEEEE